MRIQAKHWPVFEVVSPLLWVLSPRFWWSSVGQRNRNFSCVTQGTHPTSPLLSLSFTLSLSYSTPQRHHYYLLTISLYYSFGRKTMMKEGCVVLLVVMVVGLVTAQNGCGEAWWGEVCSFILFISFVIFFPLTPLLLLPPPLPVPL